MRGWSISLSTFDFRRRASLVKLALVQHAQKSVNGMPMAKLLNMLSSVFGQAANADELMSPSATAAAGTTATSCTIDEPAFFADNEIAEALESP